MKKFNNFLFILTLILCVNVNCSFATENISTNDDKKMFSTGEFNSHEQSINSSLELDEKNINSYSLDKSENTSLSKEELVDIILNDPEFNEYVETELDHVYSSLTDFVLAKPDMLDNFKTSLDITEPDEIKDFFKSLISSKDIKDCLISLLDDEELFDIFKNGNLDTLIDAFYDCLNNTIKNN